jgi:hypothetical protein
MTFAIGGETEHYQPKDPPTPECSWCDGTLMVDVASIMDVAGNVHPLSQDIFLSRQHEIQCPRCLEHPGVEPVAEREEL